MIALAPMTDLSAAAQLKAALIELMDSDDPMAIDASQVSHLTTPCVQILVAAARGAAEQGRDVIIHKPSDAFITAFDDLGLFAELKEWRIQE